MEVAAAAAAGDHGLRRGTWSEEEDRLLRRCIQTYGEGRWHLVPARAGLNRCRKSCRLRWLNYLKPNIKRGEFEGAEADLLIRLHKLLGNRWSLIAGRLPGRTANDVKNYWNTHHKEKEKKKLTTTTASSCMPAAALTFPCKRQRHCTEPPVVLVTKPCPNEGKITKTNIIRPRPMGLPKGFCWRADKNKRAQSPFVADEDMNGDGSSGTVWAQELKRFLDCVDNFPAATCSKMTEHNNSSCSNYSSNDEIMKLGVEDLTMFDHQEEGNYQSCGRDDDVSIWDLLQRSS